MSTSASDASNVTYKLTFTPQTTIATGAIVLWFCSDSPLVGVACAAPGGFDLSSAALSSPPGSEAIMTTGSDTYVGAGANYLVIKGVALTATTPYTLTITGVHNPTATGSFYGRIETFTNASTYDAAKKAGGDTGATPAGTADGSFITNMVDNGSVAESTAQTVGVTAYVLESMTFCTSHSAPTANCGATDSPSLTIGEAISGGQTALDTGHVSTGQDYMQLSTNAQGGATVNLKSTATACGGLLLVGGTGCIPGQNLFGSGQTVVAGTANFGLKLGTVAAVGGSSSGTLQPATGSHYDTSHYYIDSDNTNATGVTSTYGSKFVDTNALPVNNKNIDFTIGATIGNNTPAGKYSANLNLIATGIF